MTRPLPDRLSFLARAGLAAVLALLLVSCGPGTGGTGTGPDISFSSVGPVLGIGPSAPGGTTCAACTRADLRLQEGRIELLVPCGRFVFLGQWDPESAQLALPGSFEPRGGTAVPAVLHLEFNVAAGRSEQVSLRVAGAAGTLLVDPQVLLRRQEAAAADVCRP